MDIIDHAWTSFEHDVMPADAGPLQRRAMRDAFYSGAMIVFTAMVATTAGDQKRAGRVFDGLKAEIDRYVADMIAAGKSKA